jgi:hypothetical protein
MHAEITRNSLHFSFPEVHERASLDISFVRTLRVPDDGECHQLPPGFGTFPLVHVEGYAAKLDEETVKRGGILFPMWQSEALWISLKGWGGYAEFGNIPSPPCAVKIGCGKINALTGKPWQDGLSADPQDYLVTYTQPWIDGFCSEQGVVRQFVAAPLGQGITAEEQLTSKAEWGGVQIAVTPMRADLYRKMVDEYELARKQHSHLWDEDKVVCLSIPEPVNRMGLSAGGQIRQKIYPDDFGIDAWDTSLTVRVFATILNSVDWMRVTGHRPPHFPPDADAYTKAGLPWFALYDEKMGAIEGSAELASLTSYQEAQKQSFANE